MSDHSAFAEPHRPETPTVSMRKLFTPCPDNGVFCKLSFSALGPVNDESGERPGDAPLLNTLPKWVEWQRPLPESVLLQSALGGVGGFGMGVMLGLFTTSFAADAKYATGAADSGAPDSFKRAWRDMYLASKRMGKNFGSVGAIFGLSSGVVSSWRGREDLTSNMIAACISGGALAFGAGPGAMAGGCGTFMAFTYVFEEIFHLH